MTELTCKGNISDGEHIKKLGFGFMRLPMKDQEVELERVEKMVELYMEKGFTYFDTAYN